MIDIIVMRFTMELNEFGKPTALVKVRLLENGFDGTDLPPRELLRLLRGVDGVHGLLRKP